MTTRAGPFRRPLERRPVAHSHRHLHRLLAAKHNHRNIFAHFGQAHQIHQMAVVFDRHAVEFQNHIVRLQLGVRRRRILRNARNMRPVRPRHAKLSGGRGVELPVQLHAQVSPRNAAAIDQLIGDDLDHVNRNREANAFAAAGTGGDGGVHADHFALQIQQRPAAIARIDGRIGLHEILKPHALAQFQIAPPFGADDAKRDRMAQTERAAHGQHEVADIQFIAIADLGRHEPRRVDFHHGDIGRRIRPDMHRIDLAAVGQLDFDRLGRRPFHHVPVGEHVKLAAVFDDRARARFFDRLAAVLGRRLGMLRIDVHHGGLGQLHHFAQDVGLALQMDRFLGQLVVLLGAFRGRGHRLIDLAPQPAARTHAAPSRWLLQQESLAEPLVNPFT